MLVITLILMGAATTLIGVLPTYETVGVVRTRPAAAAAHPAGHLRRRRMGRRRPDGRRACTARSAAACAGSFPQLGVPLGMLLASGVMALMTGVISPGDGLPRVGLAHPVPAQLRADRRRLHGPPQRGGEPGLQGDRREEAADPGSRSSSCSEALAAGHPGRPGLRRQQRRRLHGHRRLHPQLRHQPRRGPWTAPTCCSPSPLAPPCGSSSPLIAGFLSDSIGRKTHLPHRLSAAQLLTVFPLFLLVNTGNIWACCSWRWACSPSASA